MSKISQNINLEAFTGTGCLSDCDLTDQDREAIEIAKRHGDFEYAEEIKIEMMNRISRCAGVVTCGSSSECGLLHGNTRSNTSLGDA